MRKAGGQVIMNMAMAFILLAIVVTITAMAWSQGSKHVG
jgi:hypothetical protein